MRLIDAEQKLLSVKQPVLQTRDASAILAMPLAQVSKILERLEKAGRFVRIMRGKWATTTTVDPLLLPEYLTMPYPAYISLQSALFFHGMISQIPHTVYAVSLARTRQYQTPFGTISMHHIQPDFFFGFEMINQIKIATPEKALIDTLYFSPAKSHLFASLPEIELIKSFNPKKALRIADKIISARTRTLVKMKLASLIG